MDDPAIIAAPTQVHKSVTSPYQRKPISAAQRKRANSKGAQALASAAANARATEIRAIVTRQPRPKSAPKVGCITCAGTRISTFIITEQTPLGRIHSGARVIGASRGTVKVNGRWREIYPPLSDAGGRKLGSAKRHRVDQQ